MATQHVLSRGIRRYKINDSSTIVSPMSSVVINWSQRVITNGGAAVSTNTLNAVSAFYQGLIDNVLLYKMKTVNCFVPDNLSASITPLIVMGNDPWTNNNFVETDLTVNGLKGNASNKRLLPGINANNVFNTGNAGLTIYVKEVYAGGDRLDIGCSQGAGQLVYIAPVVSTGQILFDCFNNTVGQGRILADNPGSFQGYFSGNRTSTTASALYIANSGIPHYALGSITTGGGVVPTSAMSVWGAAGLYSANRISFAAFHEGLTMSESAKLFSLVDTMRRSFGGGYV